jgi:hypothetical protein
MATFEVSMADENVDEIAGRLLGARQPSNHLDNDATRDAISALAQLALDEYVDWMLGRTRFRSLSELQIERIATIYDRITRTEVPSKTRLYNDFGLSHGQATYVARVLADRQLSTWRDTARSELIAQLEGKLGKAEENSENGRGEAELQLILSTLAIRELELVFESAFADNTLIAPWKRSSSVGNLHFIAVESATVIALARQLGLSVD